MTREHEPESPKRFGFLLVDGFALLPLSGMIDVLTDANYVTGKTLYEWVTVSFRPGTIPAMNGLGISVDHVIPAVPPLDALVVCAAMDGETFEDSKVLNWLARLRAFGVTVGSIATGTWILAKAGLLTGRRCTLHWEHLGAFRERFPELDATSDLFVIDGPIFTCSGGTGSIDLFLSLVRDDHGAEVASLVAQQIMLTGSRVGEDSQPVIRQGEFRFDHATVDRVVRIMQANLGRALSIAELSALSETRPRRLERLFRREVGQTPQLYYRGMRLQHARHLLRLTRLPVSEVAEAAGFNSSSYFIRCYRQQFGSTPSEERDREH